MLPYHSVAIPQCCHATVLPYHSVTMPQCCHATVLPYHSVAIPQCCHISWFILYRSLQVCSLLQKLQLLLNGQLKYSWTADVFHVLQMSRMSNRRFFRVELLKCSSCTLYVWNYFLGRCTCFHVVDLFTCSRCFSRVVDVFTRSRWFLFAFA